MLNSAEERHALALATGTGSVYYCERLPTAINLALINAKLQKKIGLPVNHKTVEEVLLPGGYVLSERQILVSSSCVV